MGDLHYQITTTSDGSKTVVHPIMDVPYHSLHGAVTESNHVYIDAGLVPLMQGGLETIRILEVGYGTGLNALLSLVAASEHHVSIQYTALEPYPLHPAHNQG